MTLNSSIFQTRSSSIWIDEESIIHVVPHRYAEVDLEEVMACFAIYKKLRGKKKVLQLIDVRECVTITKEARDYAARYGKRNFVASAIISRSLPIRLLVNFFNTFYRHPVPFKLFAEESEAITWLRSFKKKTAVNHE